MNRIRICRIMRTALISSIVAIVPGVQVAHAQISAETQLVASDGGSGDIFASSIAIGDDTAVIGARHDDDNGTNSGSVYVYQRGRSQWTEQAKLVASDGEPGERFGEFVAIDDETALIGSPGDPFGLYSTGAAYIFKNDSGAWVEQAKLAANDGEAGDEFGRVAIDGNTAVVSAPSDDDNGFDSGSVYVFERVRGTWVQQAKLLASDGAAGDHFGSIAIEGNTIVVGAARDDGIGVDSGSAYVFVRDGDSWTEYAKLIAADESQGDRFGWSVAIDANTIVIGANGDDEMGINAGAAYIFTKNNGAWHQQKKLTADDGADHDRFGLVAIDGNTILVGAPRNRYTALNSSAVYVFAKVQGVWTQQTRVPASIGIAADGFGAPSIAGSTFIIGAGVDRNNGPRSGSAFVFSVIDAEFDGVADRLDNCPAAFNPGQSDSNGDGYGDACVDPSVLVSADMDVDRTVSVGAFSDLEKDVRVGAYTRVGSDVDLDRGVFVGEEVEIGDGAVLKKDIQVGNAASIGPGVRIGKGAFVGSGAVIGANAIIGNETVICAAAEIGADSKIGKKNIVSTLAVVSPQSVQGSIRGPAPDPADCGATMQSAVDPL